VTRHIGREGSIREGRGGARGRVDQRNQGLQIVVVVAAAYDAVVEIGEDAGWYGAGRRAE
jgi:hypothetical protein